MGASIGLVGGLTSLGTGLAGLLGGTGAASVPTPTPAYQFQNMSGADSNYYTGVGNLSSSTVPQALQTQNYLYNNPGSSAYSQGANVAGGLGQGAGLSQYGVGQGLVGTGQSLVPYASQILDNAIAPTQSTYNQQFFNNDQQTQAMLAARGINNTPYGAGVESQAATNFNTNWNQNLLGNEVTAANAANTLYGTSANLQTGGSNQMATGAGTYLTGSSYPYNTAQTIGTNQNAALTSSQGLQQTPLSDYLSYLQAGTGATSAATGQYSAEVNAANAAFQQQQQLGQNIGSGLQSIAKAYGTGSTPNYGQSYNTNYGGISMPVF